MPRNSMFTLWCVSDCLVPGLCLHQVEFSRDDVLHSNTSNVTLSFELSKQNRASQLQFLFQFKFLGKANI